MTAAQPRVPRTGYPARDGRERTLTLAGGERWHLLEAGSGQPVVFLHNGGGTLWNWAHQLEHFGATHRVVGVDLPGFGRSERPREPLTLGRYADGLERLLDRLGLERPALVGNCIGASVALEVALRHPERLAGVAAFNVCGGLPMLPPALRFWTGWQPQNSATRALHRGLFALFSHPGLRGLSSHHLYANGQPTLPPALERHVQAERLDRALRGDMGTLALGLRSFDAFSGPRSKPAAFPPVLLGWGASNRLLDPRWMGRIAAWLEPESTCVIPDAGHMPMYEQPAAFNAALSTFLQTLEP